MASLRQHYTKNATEIKDLKKMKGVVKPVCDV